MYVSYLCNFPKSAIRAAEQTTQFPRLPRGENMSTELTFSVPWGKIAAQQWGNSESPNHWLAVHGWLDNSASWTHLAPVLADRGDHVVGLDLPGHGHSDWLPPGALYHDLEFVGAVYRVVKQLGWKRFGMVGHSLGGGICLTYAATFPEQVSRLIMMDITFLPIRPFTPYSMPARLRMCYESQATMEERQNNRLPTVLKSMDDARKKLMQPPVYLKEHGISETFTVQSADIMLERGLRKVDGGYVFRRDPRLILPSLYFIDFEDQKRQGKDIVCPHLIVYASKGPKSDFGLSMFDIFRQNPGFVQVNLEGLHHVHLNDYQVVNKIVAEFLDQACLNEIPHSKL